MALFFFRTTERAPRCRRYCDLDRLDKYRIIGQPKFGLRSLLSLDCGDRAGKPAEIPVRKLCGCYGGRSRNVVFVIKACGWEGRLFLYGLVRRRSFAWWFPLFCHCLSVHHPPAARWNCHCQRCSRAGRTSRVTVLQRDVTKQQ